MFVRHFLVLIFVFFGFLTSAYAKNQSQSLDSKALEILRQLITQIESKSTFVFKSYTIFEEVSSTNQKLQYHNTSRVVLMRPNKLFAVKTGKENMKFWYDGNTMTLLDTQKNQYTTKQAPQTLDELFLSIEKLGINAPLADLFYTNAYDILVKDIISAQYIGVSDIKGISCHHLAFRQENIDWQIWITNGEPILPLKIVITSKDLTGSPQYQIFLPTLVTDREIDEKLFNFTAPAGAIAVDSEPVASIK